MARQTWFENAGCLPQWEEEKCAATSEFRREPSHPAQDRRALEFFSRAAVRTILKRKLNLVGICNRLDVKGLTKRAAYPSRIWRVIRKNFIARVLRRFAFGNCRFNEQSFGLAVPLIGIGPRSGECNRLGKDSAARATSLVAG